MKYLNENLESKVVERTKKLQFTIKELNTTKEGLINAEKLAAIGQLAAGIAHEFNNILAIIRGNVQLNYFNSKNNKDLEDMFKIINEQTKHGAKIVENINIIKDYQHKNYVYVDIWQIPQVFLNLIINARHAIKPLKKGTISIFIKEINNMIEIIIQDTGIGMDEETKNNIFNPFFTTKGAAAKNGYGIQGTGLGLSVVFSLLKKNKCEIKVVSKKI